MTERKRKLPLHFYTCCIFTPAAFLRIKQKQIERKKNDLWTLITFSAYNHCITFHWPVDCLIVVLKSSKSSDQSQMRRRQCYSLWTILIMSRNCCLTWSGMKWSKKLSDRCSFDPSCVFFYVFSPMLLVVCHCRTKTQRMAMLSKTKLLTELESVPITIDNAPSPLSSRVDWRWSFDIERARRVR
jgi:hypothetical protein